MALALDSLGHYISINPVKIWYNKESLKSRTKELIRRDKNIDFELIIMYPVYNFGSIYKRSGIITMYEAINCPSTWTKRLNQLSIPIYCPSKFTKEIFKNSGVTAPLIDFPLGIDTAFYQPIHREYPKDRPFRFLTIGKLEARKNALTMVKCFQEAFPKDSNVELILKTRERFIPEAIKKVSTQDQRIKIIEKTISEEGLRTLYYNTDAFLYLSLGEAFSFPPRNAIATGMPTLVTDWSALSEIPGAIKIPVEYFGPMPPCGFSYGEESKLLMAYINEQAAVDIMRELVYNSSYYNDTANQTFTTKQLSWKESAKNLINLIEENA